MAEDPQGELVAEVAEPEPEAEAEAEVVALEL